MEDAPTSPAPRRDRHRPRHAAQKRHRGLRIAALVVSSVLVIGLGAGVTAYAKLNSNIQRVDVSRRSAPTGRRGEGGAATGPLNILVLGSDNRSSLGTKRYGTAEGSRSDTTLLVHAQRGPEVRHRRLDPPRLDGPRSAELLPQGAEEPVGDPAVQPQLQQRWSRVRHPHDRGQHRHLHQPLRRGELQRLQGHGQRPRWRRRVHRAGHRRPRLGPQAVRGHAPHHRQPGPRLRAGPRDRR